MSISGGWASRRVGNWQYERLLLLVLGQSCAPGILTSFPYASKRKGGGEGAEKSNWVSYTLQRQSAASYRTFIVFQRRDYDLELLDFFFTSSPVFTFQRNLQYWIHENRNDQVKNSCWTERKLHYRLMVSRLHTSLKEIFMFSTSLQQILVRNQREKNCRNQYTTKLRFNPS